MGKERQGWHCTKSAVTGDIKQWLADPAEDEEEDSGNTEAYGMKPAFRLDCISSILAQPPPTVADTSGMAITSLGLNLLICKVEIIMYP